MQSKAEFRLAIVGRLKHMTQQERDVESRVLCRYLKDILGTEPKTIAAYMPYLDEPDIKPLLLELMAAGWTVVMPAIERNRVVFRVVTDLSQNIRNPVSNILEASADCPPADETAILEVIVPGRAFTGSGLRMGRGNGGYDYWIATQRKRQPRTRFI
ncbi:MAG TPA: 5-formyltetrahydrofolate cyclo-ligase, partial [Candidatus Peribacteria bacterium]|nr:5-formyltetrahydrofolate cyclo-ligase [Candidatus Peribacteria bacterium]